MEASLALMRQEMEDGNKVFNNKDFISRKDAQEFVISSHKQSIDITSNRCV